jgi:hypothetical protein
VPGLGGVRAADAPGPHLLVDVVSGRTGAVMAQPDYLVAAAAVAPVLLIQLLLAAARPESKLGVLGVVLGGVISIAVASTCLVLCSSPLAAKPMATTQTGRFRRRCTWAPLVVLLVARRESAVLQDYSRVPDTALQQPGRGG